MASKNRPCVSVGAKLYERLHSACVAADVATGPAVSAIVNASLDELEADPVKARDFCAALIKAAPPPSTVATMPRKVYVSSAAWFRLHRARRSQNDYVSNVARNSAMVSAMLDKAGAP